MRDKPTVVVVNGTADEGYWAVFYLLQSGRFDVRATARRTDTPQAERLRQLVVNGNRCEIVQAANDDEAALREAFAGAQGIYGTSIYNIHAKRYRPANPQERAQCHAVIGAARACSTLEHFVWQTMTRFELPPEEIGLEAPIHFRTKWHFEDVIRQSGLPWTFLRQPFYYRQLRFGMQYGNRLVYPYPPDTRLAYVAEEDLGKVVAGVFVHRDAVMQKAVNAVSEIVTPAEIAERIHRLVPGFSPNYRQATWIERAFFDYVILALRPAFRYPSQLNANLIAGNYPAMTAADLAACERLIAPNRLTTLEDWVRSRFGLG